MAAGMRDPPPQRRAPMTQHELSRLYPDRISPDPDPEIIEGEVLDPPDPHALTRTEYPWGIAVVCACGKWECAVTGPSSAEWARRDHERHRTLAG
jgi:hypothetical protein